MDGCIRHLCEVCELILSEVGKLKVQYVFAICQYIHNHSKCCELLLNVLAVRFLTQLAMHLAIKTGSLYHLGSVGVYTSSSTGAGLGLAV